MQPTTTLVWWECQTSTTRWVRQLVIINQAVGEKLRCIGSTFLCVVTKSRCWVLGWQSGVIMVWRYCYNTTPPPQSKAVAANLSFLSSVNRSWHVDIVCSVCVLSCLLKFFYCLPWYPVFPGHYIERAAAPLSARGQHYLLFMLRYSSLVTQLDISRMPW